jgi:membrane protein
VSLHPTATRLVERAPRRARPAVELTVRTVVDAFDDRIPGLAAEIAFFVLLSLPPLLVAVFGTLSLLDPVLDLDLPARTTERTVELARTVFRPSTVETTIAPTVERIFEDGGGGIATLGFLVTVFAASRALRVLSTAITIAYDLEATRAAWKQRVWGLGLTLAGMVLAVIVVPLVVAGPGFGETLADVVNVSRVFADLYRILYWPVAGVVAWLLIATLYHVVAPWWTPWHRDLPGAALAMVLWFLGSMGLRAYVGRTITAQSIYEPLAGPLVLLLWIYVSAFAVLIGAELNAEIERMWPTQPHRRPSVRWPIRRTTRTRHRPS